MEVEADPGLLVVSLDQCISTVEGRQGKSNCVYTHIPATPSGHDGTILQLPGPIQCITDPNQSMHRFQHQLTQLQPIQYSTVQMGYDGISLHSHHQQQPEGGELDYQPFANLQPLTPNLHSSNFLPPNPVIPPPPPPQLQPPIQQVFSTNQVEEALSHPVSDFDYYKEIEVFITSQNYPVGASESYKKDLKRRSQNYCVIDGVLHHGVRKLPKKVVMKKEQQRAMLENFHIVDDTGVHLGVKKMFSKIQEKHFWRGMYVDVANYVKQCTKCSDLVDVARQLKAKEGKEEENQDNHGDLDYPASSPTKNIAVQTSSQVWQEVEIKVNGPYKMTNNRKEYIISITDSVSKFTCACAVPQNGLSTRLGEFTVKMFCVLGFPKAKVVLDEDMFEAFFSDFLWRIGDLKVPTLIRADETNSSAWLTQLFDALIQAYPSTWDNEMDKFLFKFNVGSLKDLLLPTFPSGSPFSLFHDRHPFAVLSVENKENVNWPVGKKRSMKASYKCSSCSEEFFSKKTFRSHFEESLACKKAGTIPKKRKTSNRMVQSIEDQVVNLDFKPPDSLVEKTVSAVKTYLAKTKDERRKRGKYQKFTIELQEHMASYAMKNGNQKAAQYFSEMLGTNVSDSTIRNIVKSHLIYQPSLKEEIAQFALDFGVEKASVYFSERLNRNVPHNLVRKFKSMYTEKLSDKNTKDNDAVCLLSQKAKDEIGLYACNHTVLETARHFSDNLGLEISEEIVKRFHKEYLDKNSEIITELQPMGQTTVSFSPLVQHLTGQSLYSNGLCLQTGVISQANTFTYPVTETFDTQQIYSQVPLSEQCPSLPAAQVPVACIFPQNEQVESSNIYTSCVISQKTEEVEATSEEVLNQATEPEQNDTASKRECRAKKKRIKKEANSKKRGSYTTYSPELRAEIGRYAAEHSSLKAASYFSQLLGHDVPESTARGLKEKYLFKLQHCDVTSLGYSPRGRPLRLGKYDEVVKECLKELIRSGEKVSSFLAITTAREILNKHDPRLLKENGGSIILNQTWAKSFLKRMGVRNNS